MLRRYIVVCKFGFCEDLFGKGKPVKESDINNCAMSNSKKA